MHNTEHPTADEDANSPGVNPFRRLLVGLIRRLTWKGVLGSIALPLAFLLWFYILVARVWFSLGRWPHFGEQLNRSLSIHEESIRLIAGQLGTSLLPAAGFALGFLFFRRWRHVSIYVVCYAVAVLAGFLAVMLAPGPFLNWFFD